MFMLKIANIVLPLGTKTEITRTMQRHRNLVKTLSKIFHPHSTWIDLSKQWNRQMHILKYKTSLREVFLIEAYKSHQLIFLLFAH